MSIDEEKISRLYRQLNKKNNDGMPSAQLDDAILKAAHQAIKKPSAAKSPFSGGWPAVTAIAAVLIISVILVPLIQQETPPTTTNIADETQELMPEQDEIRGLNTEKAKKHSLAKEQERRITRPSQQTPPKAPGRDRQTTVEETTAPMRATSALPSTQQTRPAPATAGKSTLNTYELKPRIRSEPGQMNLDQLAADDESLTTLTPKLWLKKIQQLIDQDKLDLAQQELDSFKTHYPDEAIEQSILDSFQ